MCHEDDTQGLEIVAACSGKGVRDPVSGDVIQGTVLSWSYCHAVGLSNFSRRMGCNLHAPTLTEELAKIHDWLEEPGNSEQIVYIYIEDHISHITGARCSVSFPAPIKYVATARLLTTTEWLHRLQRES